MTTEGWKTVGRWLGVLVVLLGLGIATGQVRADGPEDDLALAKRYAPVLYFHPAELFRPQPVTVMIEQARLRQSRSLLVGVNVLNQLSVQDLFLYHGAEYFMDAWYGDEGVSDYKNYSAHRAHYVSSLSPEAGGLPVTVYAHVVRQEAAVVLQYWFFYYYNDWFNKHEGDWELVQVILDAHEQPQWVVMSQHHTATRRPWPAVQVEEETHPAVYVALGSHASYFWGDEVYPNVRTVGSQSFVVVDRTGQLGPVMPETVLLPEPEEVAAHPELWPGMEWVYFEGNWGERSAQVDFGGPLGPVQHEEQWMRPYQWGMGQPPDAATWYDHRLRVAVQADAPVVVDLSANGLPVEAVDRIEVDDGRQVMLLLHRDPDPAQVFRLSLTAPEGATVIVTTTTPYSGEQQVRWVTYEPVNLAAGEMLSGRLCADCSPGLEQSGMGPERATVSFAEEFIPGVWDAPDVVWLAGLLPAEEVVRGVGLALWGGLLPPLIYVLLLYWVDRYEKEPKRLLAATFLWGAIPALLLAVVVRVFFNLPPSLLGPEAVEAVGAGLVAPLVEELLKGGVVLFIYLRYRREFDGILDGVIYGGMAGFGFAMTGNTVSYLGAFLLHGWAGLSLPIFVRGLLYGLDHALYTATFGAGLGWARTMRDGQPRWAAGWGGFLLAVAAHSIHNLLVREVLGLSPFTVLLTWIGLFAVGGVVFWVLARQRRVLKEELAEIVPAELYRQMTVPGARSRAQWRALLKKGIGGLRRVRRVHQWCAELAFKKRQARRHPGEPDLAREVAYLQKRLASEG